MDDRRKSLKEHMDDPYAYSGFYLGESKTTPDATNSRTSMTVWTFHLSIPLEIHMKSHTFVDEIVPKNIHTHILNIVGHLE